MLALVPEAENVFSLDLQGKFPAIANYILLIHHFGGCDSKIKTAVFQFICLTE